MRFYSHSLTYNTLNFFINSTHTLQVNPHYKWNLIVADTDDNKFVDCALNAGADYIITNDKHFNTLSETEFPSIKVFAKVIFSMFFYAKNMRQSFYLYP
jgi:predicted nucleic acid-binding protein